MEVRDRVKSIRAATGLSQQNFGELFKIPAINIANWEQGVTKPPAYVVYMLERLVQLDPDIPNKSN